jgi:hypothetical protein
VPKSERGVPLRVEVDYQYPQAFFGKSGSEVDSGCCLSAAAFLIRYYYCSHFYTSYRSF